MLQQVAEAYYAQTLPEDFIDTYNAEKKVQERVYDFATAWKTFGPDAKKYQKDV
jgi:hypothetical protein